LTSTLRRGSFQPLGMKDAVFGVPKSYIPRYTTCYGPAKEGGIQAIDKPETGDYAQYTDRPFGGHSLSSTAMDYFLFAQMLLNKGKLDGTRILGRKTVELMTSNNLPPQIPGLGAMGGGTGYGLGVSVLLDPAPSGKRWFQGPIRLGRRGNHLGDHRSNRRYGVHLFHAIHADGCGYREPIPDPDLSIHRGLIRIYGNHVGSGFSAGR